MDTQFCKKKKKKKKPQKKKKIKKKKKKKKKNRQNKNNLHGMVRTINCKIIGIGLKINQIVGIV